MPSLEVEDWDSETTFEKTKRGAAGESLRRAGCGVEGGGACQR
jgi:hypothetical protein